jgi:hypothetical protein
VKLAADAGPAVRDAVTWPFLPELKVPVALTGPETVVLFFGRSHPCLIVLQQDSTARPGGIDLISAVIWRGIVYGAADGLLLSAFPILVVFAIFEGTKARQRLTGKLAIGWRRSPPRWP